MKPKSTSSSHSDGKIGEPNRDPLTGEPGAHPVGAGIGAASGGAAGAAIGAVAGPVGAVVGSIVGGIAGGLAGKGVAEAIDPTAEVAYWKDNHARQDYAKGRAYDTYDSAYRAGISRYSDGRTFDDAEPEIRADYESKGPRVGGRSLEDETAEQLEWEEARHASRAAWDRLAAQRNAAPPATGGPIPMPPP
jgi:hypothetical protein